MNGTRGIELVQPSGHRCLIRSVAALVTQAPKDDAGMVLVALGHADGSIKESVTPVGCRSQRAAQTMRLAVGLVHQVHANRVAQLIPAWTIRIVSQADGINMSLLHQLQILLHALVSHDASGIWIVLVAVHTSYLYRLTVNQQLSVANVDLAEADLQACRFYVAPSGVL